MKEELLKGLSDEAYEKARSCKTSQELLELAKEEGAELSDEQLEAVAGGCSSSAKAPEPVGNQCPKCGSMNIFSYYDQSYSDEVLLWKCRACRHEW